MQVKGLEGFQWMDPKTWPWMVWVWIAFGLIGNAKPVWIWMRRKRAEDWPVTQGRIESAETDLAGVKFMNRRGRYVAVVRYSYYAMGKQYAGRSRHELSTEEEADEFVRDLGGRAVSVHYNLSRPASSEVLKTDLEAVIAGRAPAVAAPVPVSSVPDWFRPFIRVFMVLAGVGLVLSLWVHLGALMGRSPGNLFWMLHVGIFLVWFPAMFVARKEVNKANARDIWKLTLKGSPAWMRYAVYGFVGYAVVNFLLFAANVPGSRGGEDTPVSVWRGFSGHWMAFYSAAFAILYAAYQREEAVREFERRR